MFYNLVIYYIFAIISIYIFNQKSGIPVFRIKYLYIQGQLSELLHYVIPPLRPFVSRIHISRVPSPCATSNILISLEHPLSNYFISDVLLIASRSGLAQILFIHLSVATARAMCWNAIVTKLQLFTLPFSITPVVIIPLNSLFPLLSHPLHVLINSSPPSLL